MDNYDRRRDQGTVAEQLQDLTMEHMVRLLEGHEVEIKDKDGSVLETVRRYDISSADFKTIVQFLKDNGWSVDPSRIPESLVDQLTSKVAPDADIEDGVIPIRRQA